MKRRVRLSESDLHRVVKESVRRILREGASLGNRRLLREFGWDENRDDLIGMSMQDAISKLESEGWVWNPNNESRDMNDDTVITANLYPGPKKRTGRYHPFVYLRAKRDDAEQTITIIYACETWD